MRNLGNITAPRLFNRAYAGTKLLIEDYITQVALAIEYVTAYPTLPAHDGGLSNQAKLDLLHDTRQAFGRSVLVLQGGSIFGLCHIGVVKALHLRGLLPRIITGTATGALIAALVGVHNEDELLDFLGGEGIDLSAFTARSAQAAEKGRGRQARHGWYTTLARRAKRFFLEGHILDVGVLEECVRANVGDITFMEAYQRTKRVLNITVASNGGGVPNLLNYLTAPNVVCPDLVYSQVEPATDEKHSSSGPPHLHPTPLMRSSLQSLCSAKTSKATSYHGPQLRTPRHDPGLRQSMPRSATHHSSVSQNCST